MALKGTIFYRQGKIDEALSELNKEIELEPKHVVSLEVRGNIFARLHYFDDALADFNRVLAINPGMPSVVQARDEILSQRSRAAET
ncbi:MAG: tetratricopeptide repeat protein [Legionella sp.]